MGSVSFDYSDDTVVVTGGSSGIGRGIACAFAEAGATVINADIQPESQADEVTTPTHERVDELGGVGVFVETDVSDSQQVQHAVDIADENGGVDVMVNNAGVITKNSIRSLTPEEIGQVFGVNVYGVLYGCQAAANNMIENGTKGAIINTASVESEFAWDAQAHYAASKGAVQMITRAAALELGEHGIRVNAIAPGTTLGPEVDEERRREALEGSPKQIPLERLATPSDMASPVLFLGSSGAGYVTGETFFVDGGYQVH